jgi:hypothetical protein
MSYFGHEITKNFQTSSSILIPDILSTKYLNPSTGFFFLDLFYVSEEQRKERAPPYINCLHYFDN